MEPFLENLYEEQKETIEKTKFYANKLFEEKFTTACLCMQKLTEKTIYRKDFTLFLTSFPRCPYNYEMGYIRVNFFADVKNYLGTFLHELQHFQVIHYYKDTLMKDLTNEEFEFLKESLTVILNEECSEFLGRPDRGYDIHQDLRKELLSFWRSNSNFQELIIFGVQNI